jgi:hypothetical protein
MKNLGNLIGFYRCVLKDEADKENNISQKTKRYLTNKMKDFILELPSSV